MAKIPPNYQEHLARKFARTAPDLVDVQLIPMRRLGQCISKLAPYMGVAAFINPHRRTIVVFTNNHYYQMAAEQFKRPELMTNCEAAAYAIVQSIPELRDRMGRVA